MEWILISLAVVGGYLKATENINQECELELERSCKPFLERQIDYDECKNAIELKQLNELKP